MSFNSIEELEKYLRQFEDEAYADFQRRLIPVYYEMLGVRTPELRKTAKEVLKGKYEKVLAFPIATHERRFFGLIIAAALGIAPKSVLLPKNFCTKP
jgi:hypothetical protein